MLVLSDGEIEKLSLFIDVIGAVEKALLAMEENNCIVPKRMHLDWEDNTYLVMPSFSDKYYGSKLVSVVPGNTEKMLPVTNGAMVLHDKSTGFPVAFMNAAKLTALRTGAVGALGAKYLTEENLSSFGLIGYGVQGLHQAIFTSMVRPINKIYVLYRSEKGWEYFQNEINELFPEIKICVCYNPEELLRNTELIIAATTSSEPVLPDNEQLLKGKCFVSVGSYKKNMQELPDTVYKLTNSLQIDSDFARTETGDSINPLKNGWLTDDQIFSIGKIITKNKRIDFTETRVYKTAGMALFDLFLAQELYEKAVENGIGNQIDI